MSPQTPGNVSSGMLREVAKGLANVKAGDVVRRIWPEPMPDNEIRVSSVDDKFIYCDAMRSLGADEWEYVLGEDQEKWKFDREYAVETDEEQGWGVQPYGRNVVLTRIEPL